MGYERKFYLLVALVITVIYLLEFVNLGSMLDLNLDFGLILALAFIVLGLAAGYFYSKVGDWNYFFMAATLIVIGLIAYFSLFGQLTVDVAAGLGWAVIIALMVWRAMRKARPG
jgi:hypothetical protein